MKTIIGVFVLMLVIALAQWAPAADTAGTPTAPPLPALQDYAKPGQLDLPPDGMASLYRTPWRSNVRTISAHDLANGMGVYHKHIPGPATWGVEAYTNMMKQMAECGVRHIRLAPHLAMYINKDWTAPKPEELLGLKNEFIAAKANGIRPCVIFVHMPPMGDQAALQKWIDATKPWKKDFMPQGPAGSAEYNAYLDKTFLAMQFVLKTAREGGFTKRDSYDMEMGQNLWWGFPALQPNPALTLKDLQPGGLIYDFDKALMERARKEGFAEPRFLCSQSYHYFENMNDNELAELQMGRAISVYSQYQGVTNAQDFTGSDAWPVRPALKFLDGPPPAVTLMKPEGFMADFSRRDCLIPLLKTSKKPIALTSLGVVPYDNPTLMATKTDGGKTIKTKAEGADGWLLKSKGLTRSLAFWLNQGVEFVLLHSAYEGADDEMSHALIPKVEDPLKFKWQDSRPLTALHSFSEPVIGARQISTLTDLKFKYALAEDSELIAKSEKAGPLKASDAVALLTFQISKKKFAVAAYVVTPTICVPFKPAKMTLQVDQLVKGDVTTLHPVTQAKGVATVLDVNKKDKTTTMTFDVDDSVTWVVFATK